MDITTLRKQTAAARAAIEMCENDAFDNSPIKKYIDSRIQEAADNGESELLLNFYSTKERVLGDRHVGPTIDEAIQHYKNEGFSAYSKSWLSPDDRRGNIAIIISWR